jgi:hypothetical protein
MQEYFDIFVWINSTYLKRSADFVKSVIEKVGIKIH